MILMPDKPLKDVVADFLASAPTPEEIIAFRLPEPLQERAHMLLDKNREGSITPDERAELDEFLQIEHFMTVVKAKARLKLAGKT
jgi:hypothetical protein